MSRRKSRENAIILLYQRDLLDKKIDEIIENNLLAGRKYDQFTLKLTKGVDRYRKRIDEMIMDIVENWTLERIAIIDRNILRVAIYEMLYEDDIPLKVSVDEAIEIAKSLGQQEDTPKFINGVLGKILDNIGS
ncbi:MAG: transcription antitermination factor NusB [Actinobacteria bacterium]|nr:transcription antitermination factor NusB [Clostridia bacterium]TET14666.1 MAG: transcription antitermination factor NusB [Actinomycetota bacterium]